jgi:hypothetical protein
MMNLALGVLLGMHLAGCSTGFRPAAALPSMAVDGVHVTVESMARVDEGTEVELLVETASENTTLDEVFLANRARGHCRGGDVATEVVIDAEEARGLPLRAGSRIHLAFANGTWADVAQFGHRLDLAVHIDGDRRCIPVELTATTRTVAWERESSGAVALAGELSSLSAPLAGSTSGVSLSLYAGAWTGRVRLLGGMGMQFDYCDERVCGAEPDGGGRRSFLVLPIHLRADTFVARPWRLVALGAGLHYSLVGTFHERIDGGRRFGLYQTLAVTPRIALTDPEQTPTGFRYGIRAASIEFELPVGIGVALDDFTKPALQLGLSLVVVQGL